MRETSVDRFFERARLHSKCDAHFTKQPGGAYIATSWGQYGDEVKALAKGFIDLGLEPGQSVGILGYNRPEWTTSCIAAQAANGVSAGIYSSCSPQEIAYILGHCEAPIVVVENGKRWREQIQPIIHELPALKWVVLMEPDDMLQDERVVTYSQVLERGQKFPQKVLEERISKIRPEGVATYIYTSGTTGPPKAVMLSHRSIDWTVTTAVNLLGVKQSDSLLSYLPLAHVAEQMFSVYAPIYSGLTLYFAESMEKLPENLKEVQPSVFFGVPRVYEKFYDKVREKVETASGLKAILLSWARGVATRYWELSHEDTDASSLLLIQYALAKRLIFNKLKPLLGLGRARLCVTGAAPISQEVIRFFMSLDVPIYEVYGQSEDAGPTTFNIPRGTRLGTTGRPIPGLEIKIARDGEILVRGPNVFLGYYKDEAATMEALQDGWLHSGDVGHLDNEGYLRFTDRKKDLLITAGGKNIAPQNLESMLKQISLVSLAVVIGDQKKFLVALLTPNADSLRAFAMERSIKNENLAEIVMHPKVRAEIQRQIDQINAHLAPVEQIKKFVLLSKDFSVEEGELTPTLKIRRKVINTRYQNSIDELYA